jgi:hypothetical protein
MRARFRICSVGLAALAMVAFAGPAQAAKGNKNNKQNQAQARENSKEESIDSVADQAFKQADRNHNDMLSRTEFQTAEELVTSGIMGLGQQGVLGQPQRPGRGGKQVQPPNGAAVFGVPAFANKNRVSQAEFKAFAHGLAQEADANWAQFRAAQQQMGRGRYGMGRGGNMPQNNVALPSQ